MSTTTKPADLDLEEILVSLARMRAETEKFAAEQRKLTAEAQKFDRERYSLVIALLAAVASLGTALVAILGHR